VPRNVLMPVILLFCVVGAFAIYNSLFDVGVMLAFGLLAYGMEAMDFLLHQPSSESCSAEFATGRPRQDGLP
jgi:TctA family transporter